MVAQRHGSNPSVRSTNGSTPMTKETMLTLEIQQSGEVIASLSLTLYPDGAMQHTTFTRPLFLVGNPEISTVEQSMETLKTTLRNSLPLSRRALLPPTSSS